MAAEYLTESPVITIEFRLDRNADLRLQKEWCSIQGLLINSKDDKNHDLLNRWKSLCMLQSNKNLMSRLAPTFGLSTGTKNVKFERPSATDLLDAMYIHVYSHSVEEIWSIEELLDLKYAFVKLLNDVLGVKCCHGKLCIN